MQFIPRAICGTFEYKLLGGLYQLILPEVKIYATSSAEETDASRMTLPDRILRIIVIVVRLGPGRSSRRSVTRIQRPLPTKVNGTDAGAG